MLKNISKLAPPRGYKFFFVSGREPIFLDFAGLVELTEKKSKNSRDFWAKFQKWPPIKGARGGLVQPLSGLVTLIV